MPHDEELPSYNGKSSGGIPLFLTSLVFVLGYYLGVYVGQAKYKNNLCDRCNYRINTLI